jgi:hypothetical protein
VDRAARAAGAALSVGTGHRWGRGASTSLRLALVAVAAGAVAGCPAESPGPDAQPPLLFEAVLQPVGAARVSGTASLELGEQALRATVSARGLTAGASVPQHVLSSDNCLAMGRSVLNLDDGLSVPGEAPRWGEDYPRADADGRLDYQATRPVQALVASLGNYRGMTLHDLNLGSRTVVLHDEDMNPVACGDLVRTDVTAAQRPTAASPAQAWTLSRWKRWARELA